MCGRVKLSTDFSEIKIAFHIPPERPTPNGAPSWNVAPTDPLPIVRYDEKDRERSLEVMRWGLIPYWAKDIKIGYSTINARAEEIETKPAFREAFRQRRCRQRQEQRSEPGRAVAVRIAQRCSSAPIPSVRMSLVQRVRSTHGGRSDDKLNRPKAA